MEGVFLFGTVAMDFLHEGGRGGDLRVASASWCQSQTRALLSETKTMTDQFPPAQLLPPSPDSSPKIRFMGLPWVH